MGGQRKIKMSVFSRFVQKCSPLVSKFAISKSRNFSTTLVQKVKEKYLKDLHIPWESQLNIKPADFNLRRGIDIMLFWITAWSLPFLAIVVYNSVFIGPAKLKPLPEGYEPREEEYEMYPITRWLVKNVWMSEQQEHELQMCIEHQQVMHNRQKQLMAEVRRVITEEGDYAAFGYIPYSAQNIRVMNKVRQEALVKAGSY